MVHRMSCGFELMVGSDNILIQVEKYGRRFAKSVSLLLKIPRFVLSATRLLNRGKTLREPSFIGTIAVSYSAP
jgi:predicted nuclease of restriction endonuclease-like RecB superfamily